MPSTYCVRHTYVLLALQLMSCFDWVGLLLLEDKHVHLSKPTACHNISNVRRVSFWFVASDFDLRLGLGLKVTKPHKAQS